MPINEMPYNHWNPLVRFYFNGILRKAVKLAELKGNETILDFGCETKQLRKFLPPGTKYIGFDIVPENTDVADFSKTMPDIVFALNVFEHLTAEELERTLLQFRKMKVKKLVVSQPTEHLLSRVLARLHGYGEEHKEEHRLNFGQVHEVLAKKLVLEKMAGFFTMQKVSVWRFE